MVAALTDGRIAKGQFNALARIAQGAIRLSAVQPLGRDDESAELRN